MVVTWDAFSLIFDCFSLILYYMKSINFLIAGCVVNLFEFSLGIIVFGVIMGLFINYTKKESASDMSSAYKKYKNNKRRD